MKWLLIIYNYGLIQVVNQLWGIFGGNENLDFHCLMRMDHPITQCKSLSLSNGDTMNGSSWVCWVCSPVSGNSPVWTTLTLNRLGFSAPGEELTQGHSCCPNPPSQLFLQLTSLLLGREDPRGANTGDKDAAGTCSEANGAEGWVIKQKTDNNNEERIPLNVVTCGSHHEN